eukprot:CAMPEP_0181348888 /NCGR_PEP_ID=MMETSP1106-20121128/428_1 /TAXON_ID=81844 /ORGANISM="Mantoniella antarctica, Strain SL-175" /LENGTH=78 /DNA_ID=CAMNT_0023461235 /DNA_START=224 /DNA_END=457 /DNA_ORIENTATION=-
MDAGTAPLSAPSDALGAARGSLPNVVIPARLLNCGSPRTASWEETRVWAERAEARATAPTLRGLDAANNRASPQPHPP